MALTERNEQTVIVLPSGTIRVRDELIIERDGVEINRLFHSKVINVGDDTFNESQRVKDVASKIWTKSIIAVAKDKKDRDFITAQAN